MTKFDSEQSYFAFDDTGGTLRNVGQYLNELTGLPATGSLREITASGDTTGKKWKRSLEDISFGGRGMYENTVITGIHEVMADNRTQNTTRTFEYGPEGNDSGLPRYTGECFLLAYTEPMRIGDLVRVEFQCQVNGGVTVDTFP